jgi:hypothetical protein
MNKIVTGLVFGGILGLVDGATAWLTPEVRPMIVQILMGSAVKGMVVGLASGWFARKVNSVAWGVAVGAALGLFLAWLIAMQPQPSGNHYYLEIMLPGFVVGAIVGFLTQRAETPAQQTI